jgi:hypothetical protein
VAANELPPEAELAAKCPDCVTELLVTRITPVLFGGEFEELALACRTCSYAKTVKIRRA